MKQFTIKELLDLLPAAYQPDGKDPSKTTIQLNAKGEGGGDWYIMIDGSKCKVVEGVSPNSDLKLTASAADLLDVVSGKLDVMKAYMTGRIHFSGSLNLAMKISRLFVIPPELR